MLAGGRRSQRTQASSGFLVRRGRDVFRVWGAGASRRAILLGEDSNDLIWLNHSVATKLFACSDGMFADTVQTTETVLERNDHRISRHIRHMVR